jgi:CheY-like chemotaxis protein
MNKPNPTEDKHAQKDLTETLVLQAEFAILLNEQLDAVDYPSSPKRAAHLSETFGVAKTQAYKLLKGMATPSFSNFVSLRKMGISIDQMLDLLIGNELDLVDLHIQEQVVRANLEFTQEDGCAQVMACPFGIQNSFELRVVSPWEKPLGARPISGLSFPKRTTLAIIEDNSVELEMLGRSTAARFHTTLFSSAAAFFARPIDKFEVILLDWNLPDSTGSDVIHNIRQQSQAPIFILTGDDNATDAIVKVMNEKTIHHVAKPTNIKILIKRLSDAAGPRFRL